MYPHRMRLRGPWDCEPLDERPTAAPATITMPARLGDAGIAGPVRLVRRFGYPGRIDAYEHVWLTFAGVAGQAAVSLNGQALGMGLSGAFAFEVTPLLAARNRLEVLLDAAPDAGLTGEVALEIRRDAFLHDVAAFIGPDGAVCVTGTVVGSSDRPLELYGQADGANVFYATIEAQAAGQPFRFTLPAEAQPAVVRVELVCVAECWYAAEVAVGPQSVRERLSS